MRKLLLVLGLLLAPTLAFAQATSVQQVSSRLDAAQGVVYATAAINTQATATINVPGGLYAYIVGLSLDTCADGTGGTASSAIPFTSTNLGGVAWLSAFAGTVNTCATPIREFPLTPLRSAAPGTNVTIVSPAGTTHTIYAIRVYYYLAP